MLVEWLRLLRIHTAALTSSILVIGYLLAGNSLYTVESVVWWLYGVLLHGAGFLNNNIMDYRYDRLDPHKKHFPLVKGTINIHSAIQLDMFLLTLTGIIGVILSRLNHVAITVLLTVMVNGFIYNYISKRTILSPIPITICFGLLIAYPYFAGGGVLNTLILSSLFYLHVSILYQIGYSGYYKDIMVTGVNLLRLLGARIEGGYYKPSRYTTTLSYTLSTLKLLGIIPIWLYYYRYPSTIISILFYLAHLVPVYHQNRVHKFTHRRVVTLSALVEIFTFYTYVFATLDLIEGIIIMFISLSWYILFNYIYWGRGYLIGPKV